VFGLDPGIIVIFFIGLFAATVNGALGYGFSSLTVPVALLFFPNKVLSPALVLVELAVNSWVVASNRVGFSSASRRTTPILWGLIPGVLIGSHLLSSASPGLLKCATYVILLPLILMQAAGYRKPIRAERAVGYPLGLGVGLLYATTTISGPPLALMFNNQGMSKEEFRAALGTVRVAETVLTTIMYALLGLFSASSVRLLIPLVPAVILGLPLGSLLVRYVPTEAFRRICMSFDAWIIGFGLAHTTIELGLLTASAAYALWAAVICFDLCLLYRFFGTKYSSRREPHDDSIPGAVGLDSSAPPTHS
jgi:uncharacterized protein